jgi:hypothetical protein
MKKRIGTALLTTTLMLAVPTAAFADSSSGSSGSEQSAPSVDQVLNSSDAQQEKAAQTAPEQLDAIKAKAAEKIAKRQKDLTQWSAKIATAPADCGQNAATLQRIATTQSSLVALNTAIQSSTTKEAAKPLYQQIFTHQRVYLVVSPVVHIALACDQQWARAAKQTTQVAELQAKLAAPVPSTVAPSTVAPSTVAGTPVPSTVVANTTAAAALLAQVTPLIELGKATAGTASSSLVSLAPDLGVEATKSANAVKVATAREQIRQADANLDRAADLLKQTRQALNPVIKSEAKAEKKAEKKAEREADKAKRDAEREAEKEKRQAEKEKDKAEREAKKNERKEKKDRKN